MEIVIQQFDEKQASEWDNFIISDACNATFLQSRKFLNYHKKGKYEDNSLMFYDKDKLVAICPACIMYDNENNKVFYSHSGSTYGGLIISKNMLRVEKIILLVDELEKYLKANSFKKCVLKQNNPLMNAENMDVLDFGLYFKGFNEYKELDIYVDFDKVNKDNPISDFSKLKKRLTKKCIQNEMKLVELNTHDELVNFLDILTKNLSKYNLKPYHTIDDLEDLKKRFPEEIKYWGCIFEGKLVAVTMVFIFEKSKCVHTHYLAADPEYNKFSPMTYIYYCMINNYMNKGYKYLSWGITTEHLGVDINYNLTNTKEEFGGRHNIVSIYEKTIN